MKTISTLILTSLSFICIGQDFGKKGTVWQHCYLEEFGFPLVHDYIEVQSLNDTIIQNLQCHELVLTHEPPEFGSNKSITVCNENDRVYYVEGDSLHLLYDFSLSKGDSYVVRYPISFDYSYLSNDPNNRIYFNIRIDSVSYININGQILKKQYFTTDNPNSAYPVLLGKFVLERIGFEGWILPNWQCFLCHRHHIEGLHRFVDSEISFQDTSSFCRLVGNTNLKNSKNELIVYPIPAFDHMIMESSEGNEIQTIRIYDLSGKSFPFESENSLDKTILRFNLHPGLYFLEARLENGELLHTKFLIGE